nr:unnamed protein product [Callosobruchus chinensis]
MAQYPVSKNPDELEAWKTMMDSMIKFISASTKLMNTINERALQGPPEDEGPPKPPCEVECLICGPTRSPKICQKCAALPAIAAVPAKPAAAAARPPKRTSIVITPTDDEPPAPEAPPEEPPGKEPIADESPAEEPPDAGEHLDEDPPAEEAPPEELPMEEASPEEAPAEEPPPEEAPPEEAPVQEAPAEAASLPEESRASYPAVAATGKGPEAANCCCEEIKDLKATARSLGVLPPADAGEGGRPPCICSKGPPPPPVAPASATVPTQGCCEEPKKACCCAEKRAEDEKNKSASAGGPCGCGQSQNEGRPCGCGSNLDPPEPPLKLCACPPRDDEKEKMAAELVEKVDKAEAEIQQLRQELQRLQYFQAAAKSPAATMYKEIMKDIYAGKCNPKKKPLLPPPAKLKRPGDSTLSSEGVVSPEPALRSQARSIVRMVTPTDQSAGCSPTCPSAVPTTPPSPPLTDDLPGIVRSYTRSVDRTVTPAGPTCPAASSTPMRGSDPRKGPMPPCVSKIGFPGSRRGSGQRTQSQIEPMLGAQTQVLGRYGVTPTTTQWKSLPLGNTTQWNSLPSGNVTICTPSGGPDSSQMPTSDCEQYGCIEAAEEEPDEDYCTDYNCDNEACTLRPKEEKNETEDEEKETRDSELTSPKTPSKASMGSKTPSKTSKTSAASKPEGEEAAAGEGNEEAPSEEEAA